MEKKDRFTRWFSTMSLLVLVWVWISAIYYFAEMIGYDLVNIALYLWGIGVAASILLLGKYRKKWMEIWYILNPKFLRILIILWHLFLYFISNNIIYNFIISIAFTFYTLRRCKIMNLRGLDIEDEMDYILKWNNNALFMTAIFFLWYCVKMTTIVELVMSWLGLSYILSLFALILSFVICVYGLVRFQYVLCVNIAHVKLNVKK